MGPVTDRAAVRRLVVRVGLGPRPGELDAAGTAGFDATLATLLAPGGPMPARPPRPRPT